MSGLRQSKPSIRDLAVSRPLVAVCLIAACFLPAESACAASKESRAAGEAIYHSAGCERCHGTDWSGSERGPDLRGVGKRLKHEEIDRQVRAGGGGMPGFGDVLADAQIVQLVDFLESQKKAPKDAKNARTAPVPDKPKSSDPE